MLASFCINGGIGGSRCGGGPLISVDAEGGGQFGGGILRKPIIYLKLVNRSRTLIGLI